MAGRGKKLGGFDLSDLIVANTHEFAMFGVDLEGTIISWNPGVEHLFGYQRDEWEGRSAEIIFTEEDKAQGAPEEELKSAAETGEAADVRWHVRKDGTRFWASGVMTALYSPTLEHLGYAKVIRDQTEKKRLEIERERLLKQLREEHDLVDGLNTVLRQRVSEGLVELAEASAQLRRESSGRREVEESAEQLDRELRRQAEELESLTYSISHDLRAPLRGLDGFSQALLEDYEEILDETGKSYLRRIRSAAQLIGDLIDNLLELSRLSRREMKRTDVDLSRVAEDIAGRLRRNSPGRSVELSIEPGIVVRGDRDMLVALLEQLLSNAWKFTAKEEAARIEFGTAQADGEEFYFVRDNGVGFDMRYGGRLFAPFQRLHASNEFEGMGIGLAMARRIVRRHGGRVNAEARPGEGAKFSFTLSQGPQVSETDLGDSGQQQPVEEANESSPEYQPDRVDTVADEEHRRDKSE